MQIKKKEKKIESTFGIFMFPCYSDSLSISVSNFTKQKIKESFTKISNFENFY